MGTMTFLESPWTENTVPLRESKVALVTTGGLFVKGQEPLRDSKFRGDFAHRRISRDIPVSKLGLGKSLLDHRLPLLDPNIILPIDRLKELKDEGFIKEVALNHYSFSAYCTDYAPLAGGSAKEVSRRLRYDGVDKVVVIAASILSQETAVLIQRAIEDDGIPTVSLLYTEEAIRNLKPPRSCVLKKGSLCSLEGYLDTDAQKGLLMTLLRQMDIMKRGSSSVDVEADQHS